MSITIKYPTGTKKLLGTQNSDRFDINLPNFSYEIFGKEGDDSIAGNNKADSLYGGFGNDSIFGFGGNDLIFGHDGSDSISGGDGDDEIHTGSGGIDIASGDSGNDLIETQAKLSNISGDEGDDTLLGGLGVDIMSGGNGNDMISGNDANDFLNGGDGNDKIEGGEGNDKLNGDAGRDSLFGGDGNDIIDGGDDADSLSGDNGNDSIVGGKGVDVISAGPGNDTVDGGDDADIIFGGDGDDSLSGGLGNDNIVGGSGNDTLLGNAGNDFLRGNAGNDSLFGHEGNNKIYGDEGDDFLMTGEGQDTLYGGSGSDNINSGSGDDAVYGETGDDYIYSQQGQDTLDGGEGNDRLYGGEGNDSITGGLGDDSLYGGENDDFLSGGDGDDYLDAGEGNDKILADNGYDTIDGGSGIDIVTYSGSAANYSIYKRVIGADESADMQKVDYYVYNKSGDGFDILRNVESLKFNNGVTLNLENLLGASNWNSTNFGKTSTGAFVLEYGSESSLITTAQSADFNLKLFGNQDLKYQKFIGLANDGFGVFDLTSAKEFSFSDPLRNSGWDFGYKLGAKAGLTIDFQMETGNVLGKYDFDIKWNYSRSGDSITFNPEFTTTLGTYDVFSPDVRVKSELGIWSNDNFVGVHVPGDSFTTGKLDFNLSKTLLDFNSKQNSQYTSNGDFQNLQINKPDLDTVVTRESKYLSSTKTTTVADYSLDVDNLIVALASDGSWKDGIGFHKSIDWPGIDAKIDFDLLDLDLKTKLNLDQKLNLKLKGVTGSVKFEGSNQWVSFNDGSKLNISFNSSDLNHDGKIDFSYKMKPIVEFGNKTNLDLVVGGTVKALDYFIAVDALDWSDDWDLGPYKGTLFQYNSPETTLGSIDLYDKVTTFQLAEIIGVSSMAVA